MKKQINKITGKLLIAATMIAGLTTGATVYAANTDVGASGALTKTDYTLEEMLTYAIEDEYLAQAEYSLIMEKYGVQKPFSNIIKAEATHIALLLPLLEEYSIDIPKEEWETLVSVPESLVEAYEVGISAEENNIAMYEDFLNESLPDEVREVFEQLMNASEKHLAAFQRQLDTNPDNSSNSKVCNGTGCQLGKTNNSNGGKGQGNGQGSGQGNKNAY